MMHNFCDNAILFSGTSHPALASEVAAKLGTQIGKITIACFPDGEIDVQIQENVRGRDIFVFQSVALNPNHYLMELLIILDALKRASAGTVTAVIPYFGYSRQDRKDRPRVPITAKLVANMLVDAGATRVLTMDLHAGQVQGFFDIPVDNLVGRPILAEAFVKLSDHNIGDHNVIVVGPDIGAIKVARSYSNQLKSSMAVIDKMRTSATEVAAIEVIGDIKGKDVLLADDMCSTGSTLVSAAKACQEKGAKRIFAAATHGLLVGDAIKRIENSPIEALIISNSVPAAKHVVQCSKIHIVTIADLLGQAIRCIITKDSISSLFNFDHST